MIGCCICRGTHVHEGRRWPIVVTTPWRVAIAVQRKPRHNRCYRGRHGKKGLRVTTTELLYWSRNKMAAILADDIFKFISLCENCCIFITRFHRNLSPVVQLTISQHWFRYWLDADIYMRCPAPVSYRLATTSSGWVRNKWGPLLKEGWHRNNFPKNAAIPRMLTREIAIV